MPRLRSPRIVTRLTRNQSLTPRDDAAAPSRGDAARRASRQLERRLPSGRSLTLRTDAAGEEIEIRSLRGETELKIVLTAAGPVVTLGGGRLCVESADVVFRCQTFAVQAAQEVSLTSQRDVHIKANELHAKTEQDIHLNGACIRLNCTPDAPVPQPFTAAELAATSAPDTSCCEPDAASPAPFSQEPPAP